MVSTNPGLAAPARRVGKHMKRPQFSLTLLLLIVTLCATVFAWKRAASEAQRFGEIRNLEARIATEQQELDECQSGPQSFMSRAYSGCLKEDIADTKARLDLLKK